MQLSLLPRMLLQLQAPSAASPDLMAHFDILRSAQDEGLLAFYAAEGLATILAVPVSNVAAARASDALLRTSRTRFISQIREALHLIRGCRWPDISRNKAPWQKPLVVSPFAENPASNLASPACLWAIESWLNAGSSCNSHEAFKWSCNSADAQDP